MKKNMASLFFSCILLLNFSDTWAFSLKDRVQEHTLKNGMKILVLERHYSPTVSLFMSFRVGSVDEQSGISGTAHLLEHMLFKGTKTMGTKNYTQEKKILDRIDKIAIRIDNERLKGTEGEKSKIGILREELVDLQKKHKMLLIKDELDAIYSKNGAAGLNASTSYDVTTYKVSLPSNRIKLWAKIESDRLLNPVLREFYSERDVVMEERRQRIESDPQGSLFESFMAQAFMVHPYRRPIIGWGSVLESLNKQETERFFKLYYAPNNAVVAIVGDVDPDAALDIVRRYFEDIPPQPLPPWKPLKEPKQKGERRIKVEFDANPSLIIGYHKPTAPDFDDYVFDVIDGILSSGRTSRLYKRLVEEEKIAVSVSTTNGLPGARYPNLFAIFATPRDPHTTFEVEQAVFREIDLLKREPVKERELKKIKNQLQTHFIRSLNSNSGLAHMLSYYQTVVGDWKYIEDQLDIIEEITSEDIIKVAKEYLVEDNRTVAELVKKEERPRGKKE